MHWTCQKFLFFISGACFGRPQARTGLCNALHSRGRACAIQEGERLHSGTRDWFRSLARSEASRWKAAVDASLPCKRRKLRASGCGPKRVRVRNRLEAPFLGPGTDLIGLHRIGQGSSRENWQCGRTRGYARRPENRLASAPGKGYAEIGFSFLSILALCKIVF